MCFITRLPTAPFFSDGLSGRSLGFWIVWFGVLVVRILGLSLPATGGSCPLDVNISRVHILNAHPFDTGVASFSLVAAAAI